MTDVAPEEIMNQGVQQCVAKIDHKSYRIRTNDLRKPTNDYTKDIENRMLAMNDVMEPEVFQSALSSPMAKNNKALPLVPEGVR